MSGRRVVQEPVQEAPGFILHLAYPTYYGDVVQEEATRLNLDPSLLFALIRQESLFDATATSIADARGLAQVIPSTGDWVAHYVFGMGVVVAPILGPTLGGWITDSYSWRWIFFINVPIGVLSLLLVGLLIEDPPYLARAKGRVRIDYIGLGLFILERTEKP